MTKPESALYHHIYSSEALKLLTQAAEQIENETQETSKNQQYAIVGKIYHYEGDSSSEEEGLNEDSSVSSNESLSGASPNASAGRVDGVATNQLATSNTTSAATATASSSPKPKAPAKQPKQAIVNAGDNRNAINHQLFNPNATALPVSDNEEIALSSSLLSKSLRRAEGDSMLEKCTYLRSLASSLQTKNVVVLLVRSGRFAGAVFQRNKCVVHRACQRYTIRKGQGKAQSAQDNRRKANSMGAQLRRAGEVALKEDIHNTLLEWKSHIQNAGLVLLSCPKTMIGSVFSDAVKDVIARDDERIRKVPFDVGRPTFESACIAHDVLTSMVHRERKIVTKEEELSGHQEAETNSKEETPKDTTAEEKEEKAASRIIPLTPLHEAARDGDLEKLVEWLAVESVASQINVQAGENYSTPLHLASEAIGIDTSAAADCVTALLLQGQANPCVLDIRGRVPYFLATHEKVREAFRIVRGSLGEEHFDWKEAKVGAPLTDDDLQARKDKEAEKRRQKKARQKQKKAADKAKADAAEKLRKEEEEKQKAREGTVDGQNPRNGCHWCKADCSRKPRSTLFYIHDLRFCSSECVKNHKRNQMANAALARFGG